MQESKFRPVPVLLLFWVIWALLGGVFFGLLVFAMCDGDGMDLSVSLPASFAPGGMLVSYAVLYFYSIRYELDGKHILKAHGVLWKHRRSVPLEKITNIDVRQGPVQRMLGYGTILIFTPSTGGPLPEERLVGISAPHELKKTIIEQSDLAREALGAGGPAAAPVDETGSETIDVLKEILGTLKNIEAKIDGKSAGGDAQEPPPAS